MNDVYMADFETVNDESDCRVWAWGIVNIYDLDSYCSGNKLNGFINHITRLAPCTIYFHNARFDTEFILSYLLKMGYKWTAKNPQPNELTTLISEERVFYSLEVCVWGKRGKPAIIKCYDSYKLFPQSVASLAKSFKLPELKLEIDYNAKRPYGHALTDEEELYLKHDCIIVAKVLKEFLDKGFRKMTIGSNAIHVYKDMMGGKFRKVFPVPNNDAYVRKTYKGGWVFLQKEYVDKDVGKGIVLDVNSLFPSQLKNAVMPYGHGRYFTGKPPRECDLYVCHICAIFKLKKKHLPTIQAKGSFRFNKSEYMESSRGIMDLWLTSVDMELFQMQYDIEELEWIDGYAYSGKIGLFDVYVDYWMEEKIKAEKEGNPSMRAFAKFFLNNIYGRFGMGTNGTGLYPALDENGKVVFHRLPEETREPVYVPVATFTTANARFKTITSAQAVYDRFIYADTDSLHLIGQEIPDLEIDAYKLGYWKIESRFDRARFLRAKTYIEEIDGELNIKAAGIPDKVKKTMNFDNFHFGFKTDKKLVRKSVPGGVILKESKYEIKR